MAKNYTLLLFLLFINHCFILSQSPRHPSDNHHSDVFNVVDYGAAGNGRSDDTQAFENAWKDLCKSSSSSPTMRIPHGKTFILKPSTFSAKNCKPSSITFQIDGDIVAPENPNAWKCEGGKCRQWILFEHFDGLFIHGSGSLNGHGKQWWNLSCKHHKFACGKKPTGFMISHSNNVHISGLKFEDSPQMHIAFERSTWIYANNLNVKAPENSPNTDGIHIQQSSNVFLRNNRIATGDDCVSIGTGCSNLEINDMSCGPGHGISIGSLGEEGKTESVESIHVSNVTFTGTMNGVRIKTWQGGKGYARNIVFENIVSHGSNNPIIIDQYYCPHEHCKNKTSAVHVSDVTYRNIFGTSSKDTAVELACSRSTPCTNIIMKDINLQSTKHEKETTSYCFNVRGRASRQVIPKVPCLYLDERLR